MGGLRTFGSALCCKEHHNRSIRRRKIEGVRRRRRAEGRPDRL
jgi:hypothetical protein